MLKVCLARQMLLAENLNYFQQMLDYDIVKIMDLKNNVLKTKLSDKVANDFMLYSILMGETTANKWIFVPSCNIY